MVYKFLTINHPEADGRHPKEGEEGFPLSFALEGNGYLTVDCGREDFVAIAACIIHLLSQDKQLQLEVQEACKNVSR